MLSLFFHTLLAVHPNIPFSTSSSILMYAPPHSYDLPPSAPQPPTASFLAPFAYGPPPTSSSTTNDSYHHQQQPQPHQAHPPPKPEVSSSSAPAGLYSQAPTGRYRCEQMAESTRAVVHRKKSRDLTTSIPRTWFQKDREKQAKHRANELLKAVL